MKCLIISDGVRIAFHRLHTEMKVELVGGVTHTFEWDFWHSQYIIGVLKGRERALAEKYEKELSAEVLQELNRTAVARQALLDLFNFLRDEGIATGKEEK